VPSPRSNSFSPLPPIAGLARAVHHRPDKNQISQQGAPTSGVLKPGHYQSSISEPCSFQLLGAKIDNAVLLVEPDSQDPAESDGLSGLLGWSAIHNGIWGIFLGLPRTVLVPLTELPAADHNGVKLVVLDDDSTLSLRFADARSDNPRIIVDTGNNDGVMLPPEQWRAWNLEHPDAARTIELASVGGDSITPHEIAWADEIKIGNLVLRDVPVSEADRVYTQQAAAGERIVALGLAAVMRIDLVIDGSRKMAVAWTRFSPPRPFPHNRIGATFAPPVVKPPDSSAGVRGIDLIAHVAARSPAALADVRNGDVLLKVNGRSASEWWNDPKTGFDGPVGSVFDLSLRRGKSLIRRTVVAKDLLVPRSQN